MTILWGGYSYSSVYTREPEADEWLAQFSIQWWSRMTIQPSWCSAFLSPFKSSWRKQNSPEKHLFFTCWWIHLVLKGSRGGVAMLILCCQEMNGNVLMECTEQSQLDEALSSSVSLYICSCCPKEQMVGIMQICSDGCYSQVWQWACYSFWRSHCTMWNTFAFTL